MSAEGINESNLSKLKRKRSRLFWSFTVSFVVLLALTAVVAYLSTQWVTFPESGPFTQVYAKKLGEKPASYVSLSNPEPHLLEAISEPGKFVIFKDSSDETQKIEEQLGGNFTSNVEFEGSFYSVELRGGYVDFPASYNRGAQFLFPLVGAWLVFGTIAAFVYSRKGGSARKIS
jgi:hypothetical protein